MITSGNEIIIDGLKVEYGRVPKDIFKDSGSLFFYFETRQEQELHDEVVNKAINRLTDENEDHGVSWREIERVKKTDTYYYQLTIVNLRVRDSY